MELIRQPQKRKKKQQLTIQKANGTSNENNPLISWKCNLSAERTCEFDSNNNGITDLYVK